MKQAIVHIDEVNNDLLVFIFLLLIGKMNKYSIVLHVHMVLIKSKYRYVNFKYCTYYRPIEYRLMCREDIIF